MYRLLPMLTALLAIFAWNAPAQASGDYGCSPVWTLHQDDLTGCGNSAVLGPGNDTRVNLLLLMHDFYPASVGKQLTGEGPLFAWSGIRNDLFPSNSQRFGGSRCDSNEGGLVAFEEAVMAASGVSAAERTGLLAVRKAVKSECPGAGGGDLAIPATTSAQGAEFAAYLNGAISFYRGDFDAANSAFAGLAGAKNAWVRETSAYMVARSTLNQIQQSAFDKYGYYDPDRALEPLALEKTKSAFENYLKKWQKGQYAMSARGLIRRLYWLANDPEKLAAEYRWQLAQTGAGPTHADLAEEIDNKLLPRGYGNDPLILAVVDLMRMRVSPGYETAKITRAEIEAQKMAFAKHPELHQYLLAAHAYYVDKKPAAVLAMIPDAARKPRMGYVHFARQALRGMALDATKDRNARGFWQQLIANVGAPYQRPAAELALAMNLERNGALADAFAANSMVQDETIREILMVNVASPAILRAQATSKTRSKRYRDVALFTLLYKGLSRGRYSEFLADLDLTPKDALVKGYIYNPVEDTQLPVGLFRDGGQKGDFSCPHINDSAAILAKNAADVRGRLCVADFFRFNGFDEIILDRQFTGDQLGASKSLFPGPSYSRLEVYKGVIADPKATPDQKAYALYRAVWCYGPSGGNSCGGNNVPVAQRKAWYERLKRSYPNSQWAKDINHYW
jgi:hypothetical protein